MAVKTTDKFANLATITCTESAANTLTFKKLETGIALMEKVAWIIHRIEYFVNDVSSTQFNAAGDYMTLALTVSNTVGTLGYEDPAVLDLIQIRRNDFGAAANAQMDWFPFVRSFWDLPGGGIIVPPVPLFLAAKGTGLAAASSSLVRLWYTLLELTPDDYWQLVEARRVISS